MTLALAVVLVESLIATLPVVFLLEYISTRDEEVFMLERFLVLFLLTMVTYAGVYVVAHGRLSLFGEPVYQSPIHGHHTSDDI